MTMLKISLKLTGTYNKHSAAHWHIRTFQRSSAIKSGADIVIHKGASGSERPFFAHL